MKKFLDTSSLLEATDFTDCVISYVTLEELENIKTSAHKDAEVKYKAREAVRNIEKFNVEVSDITISCDDETSNDDKIILTAKGYNDMFGDVELYSEDILFRLIAERKYGMVCKSILSGNKKEQYLGYKNVTLSDDEMAEFYQDMKINRFECLVNEYLLIHDKNDELVDKLKWNGSKYIPLKYRKIDNSYIGKVSPRNVEQELTFDLLQDKDITVKVVTGVYGAGKDYLMTAVAMDLVNSKKFDKIILVRNNIELKNTREIGFLKGTMQEKLMPMCMPFADKVGGRDGLEMLITQRKVEMEHLGFMRGRDIKNSIIICTEAQNMTKEHLQLLVSRIGDNSMLWINGDVKQTDSSTFTSNNGLNQVIEKLGGNKLFGYVNLSKTERSETAELAYLLE